MSENDQFKDQEEFDRLLDDKDEETRLLLTKCVDTGICLYEAATLLDETRKIKVSGTKSVTPPL